jgi:farnesyl-diphosphate farnesyltransferase
MIRTKLISGLKKPFVPNGGINHDVDRATRICWRELPRVSRSFALVIQNLPEGLDKDVMVGYEILRTVDTIEDSLLDMETKKLTFKLFRNILNGGFEDENILTLQRVLDAGTHKELDKAVVNYMVPNIFTVLNSLGHEQREIVTRTALEMSIGMARDDFLDIQTLSHQDEYCHYVAGIVGTMLTDLFSASGRLDEKRYREIYPYSEPYGIGLQKVNILKDMNSDLYEDRLYWPRDVVEKHGFTKQNILQKAEEKPEEAMQVVNEIVIDTARHLDNGVLYVTKLPENEKKVRMFSAIPLYMAIATASLMYNNREVYTKPLKIPRSETMAITSKLDSIIQENGKLVDYYNELFYDKLDGVRDFLVL